MKSSTPWMAVLLVLTLGSTLPAAGPAAAEEPVNGKAHTSLASLTERSLHVARDKAYARDREARIRDLVCQALDLKILGQFVLGEHWPKISQGQRREFMDAFADTMVRHTLIVFGKYTGETFNVIAVTADRTDPKLLAITVNIMRSKGTLLTMVDGQIRKDWGNYQIIDIVGGGVSTALTLREQYQAVIERSDGRVDGLIRELRRSVALKRVSDEPGAGCGTAAP